MRIKSLMLETKNNLIKDYRHEDEQMMTHFNYSPFNDYEKRLNDLNEQSFAREALVEVLHKQNKRWDAGEQSINNIDRLKDKQSVVVIGGQQAGIATGPLYTINKIISIIQFAREQEATLNVPVIPVFWIAGEDHDYDEINHVYMNKANRLKQHKLKQYVAEREAISHISMEKSHVKAWLDEYFLSFRESPYTKKIYEEITASIEKSATYVDLFAKIIYKLIPTSGLVLIDSRNDSTRQLENEHFVEMINNQEAIAKTVYQSLQHMRQSGYHIALDVAENDGNLFLMHEKERVLLERDAAGYWVGKNEEVKLTTDELLEIATNEPERLSNNVVTRPLMQEKIFPTLAFLAGDGEIAYWSVLKEAFETLNLKMPPILPRLSITYVSRSVQKVLEKKELNIDDVINKGVHRQKMNWLASHEFAPIDVLSEELKQSISELHEPLSEVAKKFGDDVVGVAEKNLMYLLQHVEHLENRLTKEMEKTYKDGLLEYEHVSNELKPFNQLQERVWNILPWINEYSVTWLEELTNESFDYEQNHYLIYL